MSLKVTNPSCTRGYRVAGIGQGLRIGCGHSLRRSERGKQNTSTVMASDLSRERGDKPTQP